VRLSVGVCEGVEQPLPPPPQRRAHQGGGGGGGGGGCGGGGVGVSWWANCKCACVGVVWVREIHVRL